MDSTTVMEDNGCKMNFENNKEREMSAHGDIEKIKIMTKTIQELQPLWNKNGSEKNENNNRRHVEVSNLSQGSYQIHNNFGPQL
jgi:hypothetical protein